MSDEKLNPFMDVLPDFHSSMPRIERLEREVAFLKKQVNDLKSEHGQVRFAEGSVLHRVDMLEERICTLETKHIGALADGGSDGAPSGPFGQVVASPEQTAQLVQERDKKIAELEEQLRLTQGNLNLWLAAFGAMAAKGACRRTFSHYRRELDQANGTSFNYRTDEGSDLVHFVIFLPDDEEEEHS